MEKQEEASETGREENFSMMKQSLLLSDWTRLPPMGGPAPWQQALSPREKQPYPSTPPYFSSPFLSHPSPTSPNYKARCIYHWVNTNKNGIHTQAQNTQSSIMCCSLAQTQQTYTIKHGPQMYTQAHRLNGAYRVWVTGTHNDLNVHIGDDSPYTHTVWLQTTLFRLVRMRVVSNYQVCCWWTLNSTDWAQRQMKGPPGQGREEQSFPRRNRDYSFTR